MLSSLFPDFLDEQNFLRYSTLTVIIVRLSSSLQDNLKSLYTFQIFIGKHRKQIHSDMYMVCCHCFTPTISWLISSHFFKHSSAVIEKRQKHSPRTRKPSSFRIQTQVYNLRNSMGNEITNLKVFRSFLVYLSKGALVTQECGLL